MGAAFFMAYSENLIPDMTSNTAPSGVASANTYYNGYEPWMAMDKSYGTNDCWAGELYGTTGWLRYQFASAQTITKYDIQADNDDPNGGNRAPRDWTFRGSTDGTNWDTLDTQSGISFIFNEKKEFPISNQNSYTYYEVNITNINGGILPVIGELYMYSGSDGGGGSGRTAVATRSTAGARTLSGARTVVASRTAV